jgi:hypothetical protein
LKNLLYPKSCSNSRIKEYKNATYFPQFYGGLFVMNIFLFAEEGFILKGVVVDEPG